MLSDAMAQPGSMPLALSSGTVAGDLWLWLPAGGAEWVAVMHGAFPIPQRGGPSQLCASARNPLVGVWSSLMEIFPTIFFAALIGALLCVAASIFWNKV